MEAARGIRLKLAGMLEHLYGWELNMDIDNEEIDRSLALALDAFASASRDAGIEDAALKCSSIADELEQRAAAMDADVNVDPSDCHTAWGKASGAAECVRAVRALAKGGA